MKIKLPPPEATQIKLALVVAVVVVVVVAAPGQGANKALWPANIGALAVTILWTRSPPPPPLVASYMHCCTDRVSTATGYNELMIYYKTSRSSESLIILAPERSEGAKRRVKLNHLSQEYPQTAKVCKSRLSVTKAVLICTVRLAHERSESQIGVT
ncbi:hypothetical protein TSAR_007466 [Trichomalopsis sarcophagae]|uniref:Uncharacterized protein n=1 Tax=Trichomalopsis sarcophagae TaxID=543379 RepID=A0A232F6N8_9HYME|nr:hypothetical protein TSAR_007466 [Trichomalopsis sarcophagae]